MCKNKYDVLTSLAFRENQPLKQIYLKDTIITSFLAGNPCSLKLIKSKTIFIFLTAVIMAQYCKNQNLPQSGKNFRLQKPSHSPHCLKGFCEPRAIIIIFLFIESIPLWRF